VIINDGINRKKVQKLRLTDATVIHVAVHEEYGRFTPVELPFRHVLVCEVKLPLTTDKTLGSNETTEGDVVEDGIRRFFGIKAEEFLGRYIFAVVDVFAEGPCPTGFASSRGSDDKETSRTMVFWVWSD
jgi:hypothetical protein